MVISHQWISLSLLIKVININKIKMLLKQGNRQNQKFLSKYGSSNINNAGCCSFFYPTWDKTPMVHQKSNTQHKTSLKKYTQPAKQDKAHLIQQSNASRVMRNFKKAQTKSHQFPTNQQIPHKHLLNLKNHEPHFLSRPITPLISSCKSQQNLHAMNDFKPNNIFYKSLTFQYNQSNHQLQNLSCKFPSPSLIEVVSSRQVEKIDQTTCLQLQSQQSFPHNFGRSLTSTKLILPEQKILQHQEDDAVEEGQEQWSDESLSSETDMRFNQIDEQQSISDSMSYHKNMVIINHNTHLHPSPPVFEEFRKTHTIRSNLSNDQEDFSGHSIVIDKEHNYFLTPGKRFDRNQVRSFGYNDY